MELYVHHNLNREIDRVRQRREEEDKREGEKERKKMSRERERTLKNSLYGLIIK